MQIVLPKFTPPPHEIN